MYALHSCLKFFAIISLCLQSGSNKPKARSRVYGSLASNLCDKVSFKVFGSMTLWVLEKSLCTVGNCIRSRRNTKVLDKPVNVCQIWHPDFYDLFHVNNISNVFFSGNCSCTLEGKYGPEAQ